ncbi:hypothetical protein [Nannocystis punicea]|uniref:AAA ATPase domain-containing protein n=1 Tax=Nannocystis punicea TaxID=2995304 RepID=A0ABY7HFF9_9BACT|nr:hypothetical protein [Nannocystis poenicansa]WAS97936.1 hypothetical protein O0S08_17485 [Nannocystis poenicansa]
MALNWKALAPHRPLDPGEPGYISPPSGYAERLARLLATGASTILVGGPVGVGKSTELARLAALLQGSRVACLVQLDRRENIRQLTPDQLLLRVAGKLVALAIGSLGLQVSPSLAAPLMKAGVLSEKFSSGVESGPISFTASPVALVRAAIGEISRRSTQGRIALLLDGLEKLPQSPQSYEVLASLGQFDDAVDIVAVVPWFVAFGVAEDSLPPGSRFIPLPAPAVDGPAGAAGQQFLFDILAGRLGLPSESFDPAAITGTLGGAERAPLVNAVTERRNLLLAAAKWSGGLPRTFLQLMADAAQYAQIRRGDEWPDERDLADAVADQKDSFRRMLLPGDSAALQRYDGTDGREMELDRKIRLLARGVLLERQLATGYLMDIHPLVRPLLGDGTGA